MPRDDEGVWRPSLPPQHGRETTLGPNPKPPRAALADYQIPVLAPDDSAEARPALDPGDVMTAMGEVVYDWNIETDRLAWGANAGEIFDTLPQPVPATGVAFAKCLDESNGRSRFDAVFGSGERDVGEGVAYGATYALHRGDQALACWVEDRGRWFAGQDGRPRRAQGVIRLLPSDAAALPVEEQRPPGISIVGRDALLTRLGALFAATPRSDPHIAMLLVSIGDAAAIRDSYGYAVAEETIQASAVLLRAHIRRTDIIVRWPEHGFAIVLRRCGTPQAMLVGRRLLHAVSRNPLLTLAGRLEPAIAIGAAASAASVRDAASLLSNAEDALDQAIESTGGRLVAEAGQDNPREQTRTMARNIVASLDEARVKLVYQPIVAAGDRSIFCHEALTRIAGEDGRILPPDAMFPVAERSGLVRRIDRKVLGLALADLARHPGKTLSVNLSGSTAHDPDWKTFATRVIADSAGAASRLIIEITETAAIGDIAATGAMIETLKRFGVRFAMDDFGSGHSSFRNLRGLGIDLIKIDGAFIQNLPRSEDDGYFVRTLLDLAGHLDIPTVAEWVEDEETAALLTGWGVDYLQGHLFGRAE